MIDLDETRLAKLARELAIGVRTYESIFADFDITEEDFYEISKIPFFQRAKEEFTLEWNSATSAKKRLELGSLAYLESLFPKLVARAKSGTEPLQASNDVAKLLARAAGIGEVKQEHEASDRFVIQISVGGQLKTFDEQLAPAGAPQIELSPEKESSNG